MLGPRNWSADILVRINVQMRKRVLSFRTLVFDSCGCPRTLLRMEMSALHRLHQVPRRAVLTMLHPAQEGLSSRQQEAEPSLTGATFAAVCARYFSFKIV